MSSVPIIDGNTAKRTHLEMYSIFDNFYTALQFRIKMIVNLFCFIDYVALRSRIRTAA